MAPAHRLLTERTPSRVLPLGYRAFIPDDGGRHPPLVVIHGNGRRAGRHFRAFLPRAIAMNVALIVPTFEHDRFRGYQWLAGADGPLAASEALAVTLQDAERALGVDTSEVDLLGFSGGAQFAHRYALASPEGVRRAVIASGGWYTYLDSKRPFPRGCAASPLSANRAFDPRPFVKMRVLILIGERDVQRDSALRTGRSLDREQGRDRIARALRWIDHVEDVARVLGHESCISFDLLPDCGHSLAEAVHTGKLLERTHAFLHSGATPSTEPDGVAHEP